MGGFGMTKHNIYIDKYDWLVRVYLNAEKNDSREILECMKDCGCNRAEIMRARRNLNGSINNGICFSNYKERMSVLVIGKTDSAREFLDSLVHETMHLSIHIASEDDIDLRSEEVCYIGGDIARELYLYCKQYLCCRCH